MNAKKIFIIMLTVLFCLNGAVMAAGSPSREEAPKPVDQTGTEETEEPKDDPVKTPTFKAIWQDEGRILTSPFRMKSKDFLLLGGVAALTGLLIANDEKIYESIKDFQARNDWVDDISPKLTRLGQGEWNLGIAGLFYLGGAVLKDKKAKETARLTLMTFIHTGVVVQIGKHLSGRQRPSWENGVDGWAGPAGAFKRYKSGELSHYDAFPSGHTISVFGTATVIAEMYKKTVWVPVLSYSLATLCGLSRVTEDTHWLSDVFLGAVLGYAIGKYVVKKRNRMFKKGSLTVMPMATTRQISLGITYAF